MRNPSPRTVDLPDEQKAVQATCFHPSGVFVEFKKEEIEQSIPDRFEKIVAQCPDRIAVKAKNASLTYRMLNQASNQIARAILSQDSEGNDPIALLLEQGASLIIAIIGILKAGKFYVPLDPYYPRERLTFMLQDSQARLVVTNNKYSSLAHELAQDTHRFINIDKLDTRCPTDNLGLWISPDSLAWVIYTSGSTGNPKGVMQNHRNVLHETMNYTNAAHMCQDDRLLLVSSPGFADAVRTIYAALLNGASLYPLDLKEEGLAGLGHWIREQEVTVYRSVPTVFRHFASRLGIEEAFPKLRLIYLAGDSVSPTDVELYKKHFSRSCILVNGIGTTESLTFRWYFLNKDTPVAGILVPVGYEVHDKQVLLLNNLGQEVGVNCIGEIVVKSRYLSPGYWRRPDLHAAFVPDPEGGCGRIYRTGDIGYMRPDGCLEHRGRKDFQVKIRGHRIEVSEIETALLAVERIKEAVVVAREAKADEKRLVAYVVPSREPAPTINDLRSFLKQKLPDYMIPSAFVFLDALPLTPNGKVDRRSLPVPGSARPELETPFVARRTPVEEALSKIWAEVLGLDQVGVHDNFLDLGGHSLAAAQIISRVISRFGIELPVQSLFEAPTVADMALLVTQSRAKNAGREEMARMLHGLEGLSDEDAGRLLADEMRQTIPPKLDSTVAGDR